MGNCLTKEGASHGGGGLVLGGPSPGLGVRIPPGGEKHRHTAKSKNVEKNYFLRKTHALIFSDTK